MKRLLNIAFLPGLLFLLSLNACKDNISPVLEDLTYSRAFAPNDLSATISNVTTVTLTWTSVKNADHYVVEIYQGSDFAPASLIHTSSVSADSTMLIYVLPVVTRSFQHD